MSRRSRKRGNAGGAGWLGKAALGLILAGVLGAGVLGAGVLYAVVRGYLHSDGFRRFLSEKVSQAAGVDGEFTPFRWDGLAVDTASFDASGSGIVKGMRLDGLHTEVGVAGVRRGVWEIQGSRIQRLEVSLDARKSGGMIAFPPEEKSSPPPPVRGKKWLPAEVEVQGLDVSEVAVKALLDGGQASASGIKLRVEPGGKKQVYRIEAAGGTVRLPFVLTPELRLNRARLRYQDGQVFLNSATAAAWREGLLESSGEWDRASGRYVIEGNVSGVKCEEIFSEDWSKRLIGDVGSDFTLDNHGGGPVARGDLTIRNGTLTALPVLDVLAAYADTRRFRVLSLSDARTSWRWKKGEIFLSDLVLASEGLVRLEGSIFIRGRELDGSFRLGLAPGTLATIPGAETDVFTAGERGLVWAPLRITGTLDDPKEDLSERLIAAAGLRMFDVIPETGEKVIKFTKSVIGETSSEAVGRGMKVIREGAGIVEDVSGVLDGVLGGGRRKQPEKTIEEP